MAITRSFDFVLPLGNAHCWAVVGKSKTCPDGSSWLATEWARFRIALKSVGNVPHWLVQAFSDGRQTRATPGSSPRSEADFAIRYARQSPQDLTSQEIFRGAFYPICSPGLLAKVGKRIARAADLLGYPLIHYDWTNGHEAPNWSRWLATAKSTDPGIPASCKPWDLSFREELHAIDAVAAGQGIAICSDVLLSNELRTGALVKAHDLFLPGYGFYVVHLPGHPRRTNIEAFSAWMRAAA